MTNRRSPQGAVLATLAAAALSVALLSSRPAEAAGSVEVRRDLPYATADGHDLLLDAYLPADTEATTRPAVVLVHGGGWRAGGKGDFAAEARRFADTGWVAFSVDYRLTTPSAFPAEVDDVAAAVRWVKAHAGDYGVDPARIGALGASAGGHLVAMLATLGEGPAEVGARVRAAVSWSGPMDLTRLAASDGAPQLTAPLFGCTPSECANQWVDASPVSHVDSTDAPLLLINSTNELVPLNQAQEMADRLQASGVEHRLDVLPGSRHAQEFRDDQWKPTVAFLRRFLDGKDAAAGSSSGLGPTERVAIGAGTVGLVVVAGAMVARARGRRRGQSVS